MKSKYTLPEYTDDVDDGVFDYTPYGKCVFKPTPTWTPGTRTDLIHFNQERDMPTLLADLKIGSSVDAAARNELIEVIKDHWDCFAKEGVRRPIIGYEFAIDTGGSAPVCCKKPAYGPHESKIIMEQIHNLLANEWIRPCKGAWGSLIVLAAKPHQEYVTNIDDFIWRMCVSYRKLNEVTKPFEFPIPRCDDSIISLEQGPTQIFQISADADSGYHQVPVKLSDQDKLAFFAPDHRKYAFQVMPFGPRNAPSFYTAMMLDFKEEWDALFVVKVAELKVIDGKLVKIEGTIIFLGREKLFYGSRSIIDDILVWTSHLRLTILYFRCVCMVFEKYRVSFKLKKCEFLKDRTEYVGYDVLSSGNSPAQSKFDMINDWPLPTTGQSLHSFIGLVNFYHRFAPYLEIRLKPLRKLCKSYFRKDIPIMAWTQDLIQLFADIKVCITSGPILARYNPEKPTFLKTDWSADGMAWILMQPADDEESQRATKLLLETGECIFDLCKNGARLRPIAFGSRACTDMERKLHSFLGEIACGRWAIGQNRRFLWGCYFYWMCDCSAVKEVLEYDGSISYICRWAQELLGYHFACIHRSNKMMIDVDSLTRRFGKCIASYLAIAYLLHKKDASIRPTAYVRETFSDDTLKKLPCRESPCHIITESTIQHVSLYEEHEPDNPSCSSSSSSSSVPLLYTSPIQLRTPPSGITPSTSKDLSMRAFETASQLAATALVIDDCISNSSTWFVDFTASTHFWTTFHVFTTSDLKNFYDTLHANTTHTSSYLIDSTLSNPPTPLTSVSFIDWTCCAWNGFGLDWVDYVCNCLQPIIHHPNSSLQLCTLWLPHQYCHKLSKATVTPVITKILPPSWSFQCTFEASAYWGECIATTKCLIVISQESDPHSCRQEFQPSNPTSILDCLGDMTPSSHHPIANITVPSLALSSTHDYDLFQPRVVGITSKHIASLCSSNTVLDPLFPALEPTLPHQSSQHFGRRFGIAIPSNDTTASAPVYKPSNVDMLHMYSVTCTSPIMQQLHDSSLDSILKVSTPVSMKCLLLRSLFASIEFTTLLSFGNEETIEATRCYFTKSAPPTVLQWPEHYAKDTSTAALIQGFTSHLGKSWTATELSSIHKSYHSALRSNEIRFMDGKLFLFKPVFQTLRYIGLIIVPESLRRPLFSHYHCGPTGAHMGEYKTLFRMRLRFHWPGMRTDIKAWIKGCPHCIESNIWRNRRNELYFSWPVTAPFYIMHLDLWQPGKLLTRSQESVYLFNSMCDLTQFVISSVITNPCATELARLFMDQVILSFGMCSVVVVDADSKFRSSFESMCTKLGIMFWPLARGNHKGLSVERYHRFLNKTQTIVGNDRGTHSTIFQNVKTSQYAWNSSPIDNTDVTRSMAALGREFRFPLDVELSPSPSLNDSANSSLYTYLRHMSSDGKFATSVVEVLAEERRQSHRDRINNSKAASNFQIGDAVTARVVVQSQAATGAVRKLSYQAKGPFQITAILDGDSYEVQRYGHPSSATRKYKGCDLFLLPPAIFPNDPLDTTDYKYLNFDHVPLVDPLKSALRIDFHNDTYFSPSGMKKLLRSPHSPTKVDEPAFSWREILPSVANLHQETNTQDNTIIEQGATITGKESLLSDINASKDRIFFIQYLPDGMMRPRWYPIQIDMESTAESNPDFEKNNKFWCVFLAKHPDDKFKSDEYARWWPDWYKYTKDPETKEIIYGQRVLIRPTVTPSSKTHIQWADLIELNEETILLGPFNFQPLTNSNRARCTIQHDRWIQLRDKCNDFNLLPPTLGIHTSHKINTRNLFKSSASKRKQSTPGTSNKRKK